MTIVSAIRRLVEPAGWICQRTEGGTYFEWTEPGGTRSVGVQPLDDIVEGWRDGRPLLMRAETDEARVIDTLTAFGVLPAPGGAA